VDLPRLIEEHNRLALQLAERARTA
jgi:hypothetical protein